MNVGLLAALAGLGIVGIALSASSKPASSSNQLVSSARDMVRIFELYSKIRPNLTPEEMEELGRLNAAAKGISYQGLVQFATNSGLEGGDIHKAWRQTYYLPPGVNMEAGPDAFSTWGDSSQLICNQYLITGDCYRGYFIDWFWRPIGNYQGSNVVKGQSDLEDIGKGFYRQLWQEGGRAVIQQVASVASNYPGIGTAISSAITFLDEIGSGASLENATLAGARAAVPSSLRSAYDLGVGLAVHGKLDAQAAIDVMMALAISSGAISGDVLERYNTIKQAYEDAQSVGAGLKGLGTTVQLAS